MKSITSKRGFTLIELMIVVAIIGILAAIAIPKFANLITKSNEASTKGSLGAIRSALSIYYGDMEGWYPVDDLGAAAGTSSLTLSTKYMSALPVAKIPSVPGLNVGHNDASSVTQGVGPAVVDANGGWYYDSTQNDVNWGRIIVSCSHSDTKGNRWTSY